MTASSCSRSPPRQAPTASTRRRDHRQRRVPDLASLYIYVNKNALADNPALEAFVEHYVTVGLDQAVADADYVALDDAAKEATRAAWAAR